MSDSPSPDVAQGQPVWIRVADTSDVANDSLREVEAGGKVLALVSIAGRVSALDDRCPHMGGPLSAGSIENGLVVCPWHYREYDPLTGHCVGYKAVDAYPVEVRGDGVFVCVPR